MSLNISIYLWVVWSEMHAYILYYSGRLALNSLKRSFILLRK